MISIGLISSSFYFAAKSYGYGKKIQQMKQNQKFFRIPEDIEELAEILESNPPNNQTIKIFLIECKTPNSSNLPIGRINLNEILTNFNPFDLFGTYDNSLFYADGKKVKTIATNFLFNPNLFDVEGKFKISFNKSCLFTIRQKNTKYGYYNSMFNAKMNYENLIRLVDPNFTSNSFVDTNWNSQAMIQYEFITGDKFYMFVSAYIDEQKKVNAIPAVLLDSDSKDLFLELFYLEDEINANTYTIAFVLTALIGLLSYRIK